MGHTNKPVCNAVWGASQRSPTKENRLGKLVPKVEPEPEAMVAAKLKSCSTDPRSGANGIVEAALEYHMSLVCLQFCLKILCSKVHTAFVLVFRRFSCSQLACTLRVRVLGLDRQLVHCRSILMRLQVEMRHKQKLPPEQLEQLQHVFSSASDSAQRRQRLIPKMEGLTSQHASLIGRALEYQRSLVPLQHR